MSKQSDYEKGVKHGLNSSDANDFMEDLGNVAFDFRSESMKQGEEFGRNQRRQNESRKTSTAESTHTNNESDSSSSSGNYYGGSNSRGGSGGYSSTRRGKPLIFFLVIIAAFFFAIPMIKGCFNMAREESHRESNRRSEAANKQEIKRQKKVAKMERQQLEDLPAGLQISDSNFIRFGSSTIGPNIVFNSRPDPGLVYHIYLKWTDQNWNEVPIIKGFMEQLEDGTFRVILKTQDILSCGSECSAIIAWNKY